jgi:hypothetical protein
MSANLKTSQFILVQNQTLTFMEASSSSSSTMYDVPTTLLGSFQNPFGHGSKQNHGRWGTQLPKICYGHCNLEFSDAKSSVCVRRGNYKSVLSARQILLCV